MCAGAGIARGGWVIMALGLFTRVPVRLRRIDRETYRQNPSAMMDAQAEAMDAAVL